jgi:type IV pilus assembly protein PilE
MWWISMNMQPSKEVVTRPLDSSAYPTRQTGFSLIELMVAVGIVGILAAIAYPSYQKMAQRTHRSDAVQPLLNYAQMLERCYAQNPAGNPANFTYQNCPNITPGNNYKSPGGYYTITVTAPAGDVPADYTLTAVPSTNSVQLADSSCQKFILDNTSSQKAYDSTNADNSLNCWGTR